MNETVQLVMSWAYPVIVLILFVLAATRSGLRGKAWLLLFLVTELALMLAWRAPGLLASLNLIDSDFLPWFYEHGGPVLNITNLVAYCLLIPYILVAGRAETRNTEAMSVDGSIDPAFESIGGWLVLPALGLVLGGILSVVGLVIAIGSASEVSARYEGVFAIGLVLDIAMTIFLLYVASLFFAKRRGAPGAMISLMVANIIVSGLMVAIALASDAEFYAMQSGKGLVGAILGSLIWIPYFSVSTRVKRTFVND